MTGTHGGTFPVGDGPPGSGTFEYEAEIYSASVAPKTTPAPQGRGVF